MTKGEPVWGLFAIEGVRIVYDAEGAPQDATTSRPEQVFGWFESAEDCEKIGAEILRRMESAPRWNEYARSQTAECGKCGASLTTTETHGALSIFRATVGGSLDAEVKATRFCPRCRAGIIGKAKAAEKSMGSMMVVEAPSTQTRQ